jgi:hypothetical protein
MDYNGDHDEYIVVLLTGLNERQALYHLSLLVILLLLL